MTCEIKKQQIIDQQSFGSNIKDPMEFSRSDLSNKTDEHKSDNRLQNSSDHGSDYSFFLEGGSLLMDLGIPLTENEEKLIGKFCKEMENVEKENNKKSALKHIKRIVDAYLKKGIRLNACYGERRKTVTNLVFEHQTDEICQIRKKHPNLSFW